MNYANELQMNVVKEKGHISIFLLFLNKNVNLTLDSTMTPFGAFEISYIFKSIQNFT